MEDRLLEIVIISAKDLKSVKHITTMDVYLEATISGDPSTKHTTPVAKDGGTKPTWNFPMRFTINTSAAALQRNRPLLFLKLRCARTVRGDKDIGEAQVPVEELLALSGGDTCARNVSYPVLIPNGKPRGEVNFSFKFGADRPLGIPPPQTAVPYPPPGYPSVSQYPPVVVQPQYSDEHGISNGSDSSGATAPAAFLNAVISEMLLNEMAANIGNAKTGGY